MKWIISDKNVNIRIPCFRTINSYQAHLRKGGSSFDYVKIGKYIFTQDEYDLSGATISYGNKEYQKTLFIMTADRYKSKKDAVVIMEDFLFARNGFHYLN